MSPQLLQFGIPPMSLLTFVENSFKYEKSGEGSMQILIKARLFLDGEEKFVNITIMDNGEGFPEEVLEILNDPEKRMPGEHMGINNVEQRFFSYLSKAVQLCIQQYEWCLCGYFYTL